MSYATILTHQRTKRDIRESAPHESGGYKPSVKVGEEEIVFNVAIESDELADMARRAAINKSQSSKFGPLLVEVVSRRRL